MPQRYSEDDLIARVFAPIAGAAALGLQGRRGASRAAKARRLVVTTDMRSSPACISSPTIDPSLIAKKALRVNLSDLAAKGAEPIGFLLALALPADWTNDWLDAFAAGLAEDARDYRLLRSIGGDTTATPGPLTISITALRARVAGASCPAPAQGRATPSSSRARSATRRSVSPCGVTQRFARTAVGEARDHLLGRYLLPQPRLDR